MGTRFEGVGSIDCINGKVLRSAPRRKVLQVSRELKPNEEFGDDAENGSQALLYQQ